MEWPVPRRSSDDFMIDRNLSGARDSVLERRPGQLRNGGVTHCATREPENFRRFRILIRRAVADIYISWLVI